MNDNLLAIIATECKSACAHQPDLLERIKKAMAPVANGHWMVTDDDLCFRGAVAGVLMDSETTEDDKRRITFTLEQLHAIGAMISGIPVDVERALDNPDEIEPLPLIKLWHEAKAA